MNEATNQAQYASFNVQLGQAQNDIVSLEARVAALEAIPRLTIKFPGGQPLPVDQLQFKNGHFAVAHYTGSNIVYMQTSEPLDPNHYWPSIFFLPIKP